MTGLQMKYFNLNPKSKAAGDRYAHASREAMRRYAEMITDINKQLAMELKEWANREENAERDLEGDGAGS